MELSCSCGTCRFDVDEGVAQRHDHVRLCVHLSAWLLHAADNAKKLEASISSSRRAIAGAEERLAACAGQKRDLERSIAAKRAEEASMSAEVCDRVLHSIAVALHSVVCGPAPVLATVSAA